MLNIKTSKDGKRAKEYFKNELNKGDYYSENNKISGVWFGLAAKELGLSGKVEQKDFDSLIDNKNPRTENRLTKHHKENRRVCFDFTFNAPKSFSIVYELGEKNERKKMHSMFVDSVNQTMEEIERVMRTRVRKNGADHTRDTSNMVGAQFVHFTGRPVGGIPDPSLHAHNIVLNATLDKTEQQWKAAELGKIKADSPYYEAMFHAFLSKKLVDSGYGVERRGRFWEIAGIKRETVIKFSNRTTQIEKYAEDKGITSKKAKSKLAVVTRENKNGELEINQLRKIWLSRLTSAEKKDIASVKNGSIKRVGPKQAVDYALKHHLERQSTIKITRLMEEAQRISFGSLLPKQIAGEIKKRKDAGEIISREIRKETVITTKKILNEERKLIQWTKNGVGICKKINEKHKIKREYLGEDQVNAIQHILRSQDLVMAIQGKPGVGKSTLMVEAIEGIESTGKKVYSFAPSSDATENIRNDGIKNAETIAMLLISKKIQDQTRDSVIWIDEAGLISVQDLNSVFCIAEKNNARVVLSGDIKQHTSVRRGDAYRLLQNYAGLKPAVISKIRRQTGGYKEVVATISSGRLEIGFKMLDKMGVIIEVEDNQERNKKLAEDYVEKSKTNTVLAIAPTHREGVLVTEAIREELKEQKKITEIEKEFNIYESKKLTEAEKTIGKNYETGMVIKFHKKLEIDKNTFERGIFYRIENVNHDDVMIKKMDGELMLAPLNTGDDFDLYQKSSVNIMKGDLIRITENSQTVDKKHRLNNGATYVVAGFDSENNIKLENGWVIESNRGNFKHGYVTTSQNAQSKGKDYVFIAQSALSFGAGSAEQFNVSVSRGKRGLKIYTDDKNDLLDMVKQSTRRLSAVDMIVKSREDAAKNCVQDAEKINRDKQNKKLKSPLATREKQINRQMTADKGISKNDVPTGTLQ